MNAYFVLITSKIQILEKLFLPADNSHSPAAKRRTVSGIADTTALPIATAPLLMLFTKVLLFSGVSEIEIMLFPELERKQFF